MAATILHFGPELGDRFSLLRNAGYSLHRFEKIAGFRLALQSEAAHDAVSVAETEDDAVRFAVLSARAYSRRPLILFRTCNVISFPGAEEGQAAKPTIADADFDLVVPARTSSPTWVADINALIGRSVGLREWGLKVQQKARTLRGETAELIEKTRFEMKRAQLECGRNAAGGGLSSLPADKVLTCLRCGVEFVFSAGEQLSFQKRQFANDPKLCKHCRFKRGTGSPPPTRETRLSCAVCGVSTTVPFKPTQGRPVLCRVCFEKHGPSV